MKLVEVAIETRDDKACLVGVVQTSNPSKEIRVKFSYPRKYESFLMPTADAFFPVLLLPAMAAGEPLELVPPLSRKLFQAAPHIQGMLVQWYRGDLSHVEVRAPIRESDPVPEGKGVASFFSGGVDSYFTLLRNIQAPLPGDPPITHLIFLDGYENPFEKMKAHSTSIQSVREAAEHYGKEAILGETNIRSLFSVPWGTQYHGAAMGGVANSLSAGLRFVYIASSYNYGSMRPWGSHPLLDPYWSTERMTVRHDGAEARRIEKISPLIENDPFALSHLRVCIDSHGRGGNCGRCRKCLRTMTVLALLGKLDGSSFPSQFPRKFETKIPREIIRKHGSSIESELRNAANTLELAERIANPDPRVVRYLENLVRLAEKKLFWKGLFRSFKVYFGPPDWRGIRNRAKFD